MLLTGVVFVLRIAFHGVLLWITIGCDDNFAYFCEYVVVTRKACTEKNELLSYCLGYRLETEINTLQHRKLVLSGASRPHLAIVRWLIFIPGTCMRPVCIAVQAGSWADAVCHTVFEG